MNLIPDPPDRVAIVLKLLFSEQLFGEMLSSSEDEMGPTINIMDEDEDSRLSVDDSRLSEPYLVSAIMQPYLVSANR